MILLDFLRSLYSLDTLDSRFSASSSLPPKQLQEFSAGQKRSPVGTDRPVNGHSSTSIPKPDGSAPPSRWKTSEFYGYYIIFILVVPQMFKVCYDVSKASDPNFSKFEPLLSPGWLFGRKVDNSDAQYSGFRNNVPYLAIFLVLHPLLRKLYEHFKPLDHINATDGNRQPLNYAAVAEIRMNRRTSFDVLFSFIFIPALHGFSAFKVLLILFTNFSIATRIPRQYIPLATWSFNIGTLFANELCGGYPYSRVSALMSPGLGDGSTLPAWGSWLDKHSGLQPRWEVLFNITVLRLISFNMDYYWSVGSRGSSPVEKKQLDPSNLSERDRLSVSAPAKDYNFRNYLAYVLYAPLYLTGPIITFNDYLSQLRYPLASISPRRTLLYGIRFALALLCMEFVLHFIYAVAISKSNPDWGTYSPFQLSMLGYFNLHIIWLKLLLPWRFFRLWALADGVDPPENMIRCMSNNYSALAFWRSWHRSFNRWITRYIYIPLGGNQGSIARSATNYLAVFTFVALWHDINLRLLMWGWLVTLFILPELIARYLFPRRKWASNPEAYRVLSGFAAAIQILFMMAVNLIGFAVGLDGLKGLVQGIAGSLQGLVFLVTAISCLFVGVQVMFEIREEELRQGLSPKC